MLCYWIYLWVLYDCQNKERTFPSALTAWFLCLRRIICYEVGTVPVRKFSRHFSWRCIWVNAQLCLPTTWRRIERVHVYLHLVLVSALDGGEWSTSGPGRFIPREKNKIKHLTCWLGSWVGLGTGLDVWKNRICCPCRDSNVNRPVSIPTMLTQRILFFCNTFHRIL